jgi:hypothetical protein
MPKSDDPVEQLRAQRKGEPENVVEGLVKKGLEKIPFAGIAVAYLRGRAREEREEFFDNAVLDILKAHDTSIDEIKAKIESENVQQVIGVSVERIFWGASEKKVKRFAAVVANTIEYAEEEQNFEDAASFIRALDELSEDDLRVLKHLYNHQKSVVLENHAIDYNSVFRDDAMRHMLMDARNLGMQMDEFYARCNRLSGYGLALELNTRHGSMGDPNDLAFRMTLLGRRLVEILMRAGESTDVRQGQQAGRGPT